MPTSLKQLGKPLFIAGIGALLALYWLGWIKNIGPFDIAVLIALIGGYKIFGDAVWGLLHGEISSDLAIAIAACAALAIGQYFAAAEVIFIMLVGGWLEEFAVDRTRGAIEKLIRLVPRSACVRRGGELVEVAITGIRPGDVVVVRPGERIAVDGEVAAGSSAVDQSAITGESIPASKATGDKVFAGTINQVGSLDVRVTAVGEDSTLGKIIHLVEEAEEKKAVVHQRADRWAVWFVPTVLALGLATFFFSSGDFGARLLRAVSVLIVACPCALVLATPTGIAAGIGRLARAGVLVKGGVTSNNSRASGLSSSTRLAHSPPANRRWSRWSRSGPTSANCSRWRRRLSRTPSIRWRTSLSPRRSGAASRWGERTVSKPRRASAWSPSAAASAS